MPEENMAAENLLQQERERVRDRCRDVPTSDYRTIISDYHLRVTGGRDVRQRADGFWQRIAGGVVGGLLTPRVLNYACYAAVLALLVSALIFIDGRMHNAVVAEYLPSITEHISYAPTFSQF